MQAGNSTSRVSSRAAARAYACRASSTRQPPAALPAHTCWPVPTRQPAMPSALALHPALAPCTPAQALTALRQWMPARWRMAMRRATQSFCRWSSRWSQKTQGVPGWLRRQGGGRGGGGGRRAAGEARSTQAPLLSTPRSFSRTAGRGAACSRGSPFPKPTHPHVPAPSASSRDDVSIALLHRMPREAPVALARALGVGGGGTQGGR